MTLSMLAQQYTVSPVFNRVPRTWGQRGSVLLCEEVVLGDDEEGEHRAPAGVDERGQPGQGVAQRLRDPPDRRDAREPGWGLSLPAGHGNCQQQGAWADRLLQRASSANLRYNIPFMRVPCT